LTRRGVPFRIAEAIVNGRARAPLKAAAADDRHIAMLFKECYCFPQKCGLEDAVSIEKHHDIAFRMASPQFGITSIPTASGRKVAVIDQADDSNAKLVRYGETAIARG
jgi:hypothetical protein